MCLSHVPTQRRRHRSQVTCRAAIARRYARAWLLPDLLTLVPLEVTWLARAAPVWEALRLNRLLRLNRVMRAVAKLAAANATRVVNLLGLFAAAVHWIACGWWMVGVYQEHPERWTLDSGLEMLGRDASVAPRIYQQYTASAYWSLSTMTTVG